MDSFFSRFKYRQFSVSMHAMPTYPWEARAQLPWRHWHFVHTYPRHFDATCGLYEGWCNSEGLCCWQVSSPSPSPNGFRKSLGHCKCSQGRGGDGACAPAIALEQFSGNGAIFTLTMVTKAPWRQSPLGAIHFRFL